MVRLTHAAVSIARTATFLVPLWLRRRLPGARAAADTLSGVNEWDKPRRPGQVPVVLVHGTETGLRQWGGLVDVLRREGRPVFALTYGREADSLRGRATGFGTGHLAASAGELALFVERVREHTGARRVDIVGHSQGGLLGHLYVKWLGGRRTVRQLVTLGAPVHGASPLGPFDALAQAPLVGAGIDALLGPSAREQLSISPVIRELSATPDVVPGVRYTAIVTRYDDTVIPVDAQLLRAPGGDAAPGTPPDPPRGAEPRRTPEATPESAPGAPRGTGADVANRYVQDEYPDNRVGHADLPLDPQVIAMVLDALGRADADTADSAGTTGTSPTP